MSESEHTFLFADLVGFTALTDAEGDERAAAVGAALQSRVRVVAADHDAEVVKGMGDAAMVRCGDPASAVRFALRLVQEVDLDPALPPIRIGVHSGSAVSHDGDWYGRAVNVASRLCSVAAGGEVLISESTLSAASDLPRIAVGERRLHWLKNVTKPVAARTTEPDRRSARMSRLRARHCPFGIGQESHATAGGIGA